MRTTRIFSKRFRFRVLHFFVDHSLQEVVAEADIFDCRALVPIERIAVVVQEFGAVVFFDVNAEILKFFDEFLTLTFAEHILFGVSDETYGELFVDKTERRKRVGILVLVEVFDVNAAEIEEDFVGEVERHFLSECFADIVDAAIEHSGAEFKIGGYAEFCLQFLVGGYTREHCGIMSACGVARYAHGVEV